MNVSNLPMARLSLACLDLTSLNDGDSQADIEALCGRAQGPHGHVAALCVWPRLAALARRCAPPGVAVAAVANFPAGGLDVAAVLHEVEAMAQAGVDEVDLVLPWRALKSGDSASARRLVQAVRDATPGLRLKLIIESGELVQESLIRQACQLGIDAGADFLKTSTGRTPVGATPAAARLMLQTIAADGGAASRVGFKASGGIRTVADAAVYIELVEQILGADALTPRRLRIGASSLLNDIHAQLSGQSAAGAPREGY